MPPPINVRWGLDLGTTNSALAMLDGTRVRIVPSRLQERLTPSAVYFYEADDGEIHSQVGRLARNRIPVEPRRVALEFKGKMGEPAWLYVPEALDHAERAHQLSERVLRELRNSVILRGDLPDMEAGVITVPAAFTNPMRDDTLRAGRDAGLAFAELLPEPVAAALAYGRRATTRHDPIWLTYDLGGGTFDAALVRGEDGVFTILDHAGDRFLGGKDLDRAIVEELVTPRLDRSLQNRILEEESTEWFVLKAAAEEAKCALSVEPQARFEARIDGRDVRVTLRREEVEALQTRVFGRTLDICRTLMERNGIGPGTIEKVILVGGPTLSPFLRQMIQVGAPGPYGGERVTGLGIPIDCSVDPMTAVAEGAAVYAASRSVPADVAATLVRPSTADGAVAVDLVVPQQVREEDVLAAGVVRAARAGVTVEARWVVTVERVDSDGTTIWTSLPASIDSGGRFVARLSLMEGLNSFRVRVLDAAGTPVSVLHDRFEVHRGISIRGLTLPRGIGIADAAGRTIWFFRKGEGLPARKVMPFRSTIAVDKGRPGNAIVIPVVEGTHDKAKLNGRIYTLTIGPEQVPVSIPEGSSIVVLIEIDESQQLRVSGRLEDYGVAVRAEHQSLAAEPERIRATLEQVRKDLDLFRSAVDDDSEIAELVRRIDTARTIPEVDVLLGRGSAQQAEPWSKAADRTLELAAALEPHLDRVNEVLAWQVHRRFCDENVNRAMAIVREVPGLPGTWIRHFEALVEDYGAACAARDRERSEDIAYTAIPEHFKSNEYLQERVGGQITEKGEAERTRGQDEVRGSVELA